MNNHSDDQHPEIINVCGVPFKIVSISIRGGWAKPKQHVCPCCTNLLPPEVTVAEALLELHYLTTLLHRPTILIANANATTGDSMKQVLAVKLADDMVRCGMGLVFRAIYEEWSQERINREVY